MLGRRDTSRNASIWFPFRIGSHLRSRVLFDGGVVQLGDHGGGFLKTVMISCHQAGETGADRSIGGVHAVTSPDGYDWVYAGTVANDSLIESSEGANENDLGVCHVLLIQVVRCLNSPQSQHFMILMLHGSG